VVQHRHPGRRQGIGRLAQDAARDRGLDHRGERRARPLVSIVDGAGRSPHRVAEDQREDQHPHPILRRLPRQRLLRQGRRRLGDLDDQLLDLRAGHLHHAADPAARSGGASGRPAAAAAATGPAGTAAATDPGGATATDVRPGGRSRAGARAAAGPGGLRPLPRDRRPGERGPRRGPRSDPGGRRPQRRAVPYPGRDRRARQADQDVGAAAPADGRDRRQQLRSRDRHHDRGIRPGRRYRADHDHLSKRHRRDPEPALQYPSRRDPGEARRGPHPSGDAARPGHRSRGPIASRRSAPTRTPTTSSARWTCRSRSSTLSPSPAPSIPRPASRTRRSRR